MEGVCTKKLFKSSNARNIQGFRDNSYNSSGFKAPCCSWSPKTRGDRFIPRRASLNIDSAHRKLILGQRELEPEKDIFNQEPFLWKVRLYKNELRNLLDPNENNGRILNFSDPVNTNYKYSHNKCKKTTVREDDWPVKPRTKPLIGSPECILDLPDIRNNIYVNVMDWGNSGYMAAAFHHEVFAWHYKLDKTIPVTYVGPYCGTAVCWDNRGIKLIIGTNGGYLESWNMETGSKTYEASCYCVLEEGTCILSSIAWDPHDKLILSGCSKGSLCVFTSSLVLVGMRVPAHDYNSSIIAIKFSPDGQYVATSGSNGTVRLWNWPSLTSHLEINYSAPVRALSWHPWCGSKLALGGGPGQGSLTLWNISAAVQTGYYKPNAPCFLDYLTYSDLTGELVASYWVHGSNSRTASQDTSNEKDHAEVLVLGSLNRTVDSLYGHSGRVLYMMWSPDRTELATAGADETLCVWNFFGSSTKQLKYHKSQNRMKHLNAKAISLTEINSSNNFGNYIR